MGKRLSSPFLLRDSAIYNSSQRSSIQKIKLMFKKYYYSIKLSKITVSKTLNSFTANSIVTLPSSPQSNS